MSDSKIFIPQLWEDKGPPVIQAKEVTVKIIASNKYKYFILHSVAKEIKVSIVSCKLLHKDQIIG